ncbi:type II secretion system protein GspD [Malaciobacter pacificus]|uniref:Type II secretion/transformation system, D protein n=1 Tax=Malaciobacter pacificus TaxID=1080223 RepID=A0A5C2H7L1_9BACT|nr:secretin N-terminal domain-containing protein [Malaciobacter pacificus]QEP34927.1 type II secretion/transformation system, D protein [Malaciobacter pacificus]GGD43270.1 type II secretion system protein GspD [Malaciobacter pacificus]
MKLISSLFLVFILSFNLYGKEEKININFKDLKIMDLVKITSKIIDKNILVTENINGNVDFISNKPLDKSELIKILSFVLEDKGFSLVASNDILRIVKLNESAKSNVPVITGYNNDTALSMVTTVFPVYNADVDYIASKIRHLISKNGKLVTNKESNSLVMTDFSDNIETVRKVVSIMTYGGKKDSLIVNLENIIASDAKKNLDEISKSKFNQKIETEKVAIISNKDNNSLVLIGKKQNIDYLAKYIRNIDTQGSLIKREVEVMPLKNVEATNVIKIIDAIIGKKVYVDPNDKPLASIDEESNSIVVMGPSDELDYVKALINELDKEKAQVYVQARIIEVNDELVDRIGVSYGIFGGKVGNNGLAAFSSSLNGGSNSINDVIDSLNLTIPNITSGLALGASLNLLKQNGALDIVSEPSILAINNKESSIYVGETISIKTSSSFSDSGDENANYKREDVGLTLKVKPRISNDTKVTLEISTILEGVKTTNTGGNPDTSKKEIKTTAILNNGESVIIGGLIENKTESTNQKVPLLGDIPLFGELFKNKVNNTKKNNLVVIVTPYMIPKTKDITFVRNELAELKNLEDKYLADSLIRLKKEAIRKKLQEKQRDEELVELEKKLAKLENKNTSTTTIDDSQTEHEKRVKEFLGY